MGGGRFSDSDWSSFSRSVRDKPAAAVFTRRTMKSTKDPRSSFDPKTIQVRESRDSEANPNSSPIIIAFDVTGSMGDIPEYFVKEGLGVLMKEIFDRKPVTDPHIMCMAVGDAYCDDSPLQVSQFEADIKIAEQIKDFYLEGGGGSNEGESYHLPWYFAANKTSTDAFEKRGKKGILFTIGDEPPLKTLRQSQIKAVFGDNVEADLTSEQLLEMVRRQYDVFHVIVEQGSAMRYGGARVVEAWEKLIGKQNILRLSDYKKLSEVITAAIQVIAGDDPATVSKSWSGDTSLVVADALKNVVAKTGKPKAGKGGGPVALPSPKVA